MNRCGEISSDGKIYRVRCVDGITKTLSLQKTTFNISMRDFVSVRQKFTFSDKLVRLASKQNFVSLKL